MKSRELFQQKENLNDMKAKQLFIQIGIFLALFTVKELSKKGITLKITTLAFEKP